MQSAGVRTSLEPDCSRVTGSNPVTSAGDRADILCVLQGRILLSDVSVTHCCHEDMQRGTAAETAKVVAKYALRGGSMPPCLCLVPLWRPVSRDVRRARGGPVRCLYSTRLNITLGVSCSVVSLRWWASVSYACVCLRGFLL